MQEVLGIKIKLDGANLRDVHTTPTLIYFICSIIRVITNAEKIEI